MKRTILFLFTIIISFTLSAQENNTQVITKLENESGKSLIQKRAASYKSVSSFNQAMKSNLSNQFIEQRLDSAISLWRETSIDSFIPYDKTIFEYDSSGAILSMINQEWDENMNLWDLDNKDEFTFDSNGDLSVIIESSWDESSAAWLNDYKEEYTYNANGDIELEVESELDTNSIWVDQWKSEYTYNGTELELIVDYSWDDDSLNWQAEDKYEYLYSGGLLIELLESYWDETYWKQDRKDVFTLDINGNIVEVIVHFWFTGQQAWVASRKQEYGYDTQGNPNLEIIFGWNSGDSVWQQDGKYEYLYNQTYSISDLQLPPLSFFTPDYNNEIHNMPVSYEYYTWQSSIWFMNETNEYYYSEHEMVNIAENEETILQVYPNPSSDKINISGIASTEASKVEILDIGGRVILSKIFLGNTSIDTHEMCTGVYIYRISCESDIIQTGKIVIQ